MYEVIGILFALPMVLIVIAVLLYILGPIVSLPVFIAEAIIHRGGRGYHEPPHPA